MHVDAPLLDDLLKAESGERYVPIVKRLLNVPYRPEFADFAQSLRTQWELGAIDIFVENVAESVRGLLDAPEEAKWDLIELAYTEASAIDHQRLPALRRALEEHGRLEPRNNAFTQSVQSARLRHQLTPHRLAFFPTGRLDARAISGRALAMGGRGHDIAWVLSNPGGRAQSAHHRAARRIFKFSRTASDPKAVKRTKGRKYPRQHHR